MEKTFKILTAVFGGIGIIMLIIGVLIFKSTKDFQSKAILTEGTVIEMVQMRGSNGMLSHAPVVSYMAKDEQEHIYYSSSYSNPPSYSVGEKVQIYYDPANPDDAQLGGGASIAAIIVSAIGFFFLLAAIIILLVNKNKAANAKMLMQNGRKLQADIITVDYNTSININDRNPFVITCQWSDTQQNEVLLFQSGNIWFDPSPFLADKKQLDVYVDFNNFKKYYVDISFLPKEA